MKIIFNYLFGPKIYAICYKGMWAKAILHCRPWNDNYTNVIGPFETEYNCDEFCKLMQQAEKNYQEEDEFEEAIINFPSK